MMKSSRHWVFGNSGLTRDIAVRLASVCSLLAIGAFALAPQRAVADQSGVSFWLPGTFGSLAAVPVQPGLSAAMIYYHTSVSAGGDVSLVAKEFEVLRETAPRTGLIGFLVNPTSANSEAETKNVLAAAKSVGQKLLVVQAHTDSELEAAFVTLVQQHAGALVVAGDAFFLSRRNKLVELAARQSMPTIYNLREYAVAGGLMSYGTSIIGAHRWPLCGADS
jgi:hypothetical protein